MALLFAKCSDTLQIYGDEKSSVFSQEAQEEMGKVAAPPVAKTLNGADRSNVLLVVGAPGG